MNRQKEIIAVLVAVAVILGAIFFLARRAESPSAGDIEELQEEAAKLNPFNQEEPGNPFEESSNPYENIKTNPFE